MNFDCLNNAIQTQKMLGHLPENKGQKIVIALSGGVDSSVAAALLKQTGYRVEAIFMKNWEEDDTDEHCSAQQDLKDAQAVCAHLGIRLHAVNFSAQYWDDVFEKFLNELRQFRTPNPDILCNKWIKFDACLKYARQVLNADFLATGHYATIKTIAKETHLLKATDLTKDQSYFLHALSGEQLSQSLFPIGSLKKSYIRQLALLCQLPTAAKKDSTGICFIGPKKFSSFLARYIQKDPGPIFDANNCLLGQHIGLSYYTVGQRKGLGLSHRAECNGQAWYVIKKDLARNALIVTKNVNDPSLFATTFLTEQVHWINDAPKSLSISGLQCRVKVRYQQKEVPCTIYAHESSALKVVLNNPLRACTPGQSAVFYQDDLVLGGAIIQS